MGRDSSYKKPGEVIVTVPISSELRRRLRIRAAIEDMSIKALVTKLIEDNCP